MIEGVNLIKIHYKHICKSHNVSPCTTIYANKKEKQYFLCDFVRWPQHLKCTNNRLLIYKWLFRRCQQMDFNMFHVYWRNCQIKQSYVLSFYYMQTIKWGLPQYQSWSTIRKLNLISLGSDHHWTQV
jgi:hypothetical protein